MTTVPLEGWDPLGWDPPPWWGDQPVLSPRRDPDRYYIQGDETIIAEMVGRALRPGRREYVCISPLEISYRKIEKGVPGRVIQADMFVLPVRCRKCPGCLRQRRAMWISRCIVESTETARKGYENWFLTVTDGLGLGDEVFCKGITHGFKRLRADVPLRYLMIFERQEKSGRPHLHAIVHPQSCSTRDGFPMNYGRFWTEFRRYGFIEAHVLTGDVGQASAYVAKYLGKDPIARVRASLRYGELSARSETATSSNHCS